MKKLFIVWAMLCGLVQPAFASEQGAREFADELAHEAVQILENNTLTEEKKQQELERLFGHNTDLDWVARFVLGKHWRTASEEQREKFVQNYRHFVISNFTSRLGEYANQQYEITKVRQNGDPNEYKLTFEIKSPGEPPIYVDYRVRQEKNGYQIFDIIVEGVSLITTQRSEFNSVVSRKGLNYLITALAKKAKQS